MEKGDHFFEWHQIWSIFNWRIKIHEKYCYFGIFALDLHSPRKLLRSISFHQIGVKIAQNSIFAFIFDLKALYRWMPPEAFSTFLISRSNIFCYISSIFSLTFSYTKYSLIFFSFTGYFEWRKSSIMLNSSQEVILADLLVCLA